MRAIDARPQAIKELLLGHEFIIPAFQRPYSWGVDECDQLWDDISAFLGAYAEENDTYFLGSIVVYQQCEGSDKVWSVIDGQQRLVTLLMLFKAMYRRVGTMSVIEKMIYKLNPHTHEPASPREPGLESNVQAGGGRNDREDFNKVMVGGFSETLGTNSFKRNYQCLEKAVGNWCDQHSGQLEKLIGRMLDSVKMLVVECKSQDDALTLFQTINDRGMPLDDADIFKAELYKAASESGMEDDFIQRWKEMEDHEDLFRVAMHIFRAEKDDIGKEVSLRKYMEGKRLGPQCELVGKWGSIMQSLELCHWVNTVYSTVADEKIAAWENIYWDILARRYPNVYWRYPLYVYLHKHADWDTETEKGGFYLPPEKNAEYTALMRNTVRYFFIKGVVYNRVQAVRETAYRVCAAIEHERDYVGEYEKSIAAGKNDIAEFERKLQESDCGRCRNGLVVLAAAENTTQDSTAFASFVTRRKYDIEHILPRRWRDYDGWDKKSHEAHIGSIGNLVPLEVEINRGAGNEWFPYKQDRYAKSKVQDAKDLCKLSHWHPEDVKKRQEESVARLLKFFKEFERV